MLMISVSESVLVKSECFFNKGQSGMDDIETQTALYIILNTYIFILQVIMLRGMLVCTLAMHAAASSRNDFDDLGLHIDPIDYVDPEEGKYSPDLK